MKKNIIILVVFFLFLSLFVQKNIIQINNNLAVVDFEKGKIVPAIKKFKNAIKYKGQKNILKYNLANANFKINNHEEAKKIYMDLLKDTDISNSLKSEIYFNIGNIAFMYENYEEALENYYMALLLNSADEDIKFNIEMIEYMNRPIIYNNEILLLPRKKIEEQIVSINDMDNFEYKVNDDVSIKNKEYQNEYSKISKDMLFKIKYLSEISKAEYKKLEDSKILYKKSVVGVSENSPNLNAIFKEIDEKLKHVYKKFIESRKNIDMFENCKDRIIKEVLNIEKQAEQRQKLESLLLTFADKYNDQSEQFRVIYNSIFKDNRNKLDDKEERNILFVRDSEYKINQLQYETFMKNHSEILLSITDLLVFINKTLTGTTAQEQKILAFKLIEAISFIGNVYIQEQFVNYENMNKVLEQISVLEKELSNTLGEGNDFYTKLSKNTDYNQYIILQNKVLKYKDKISNLYLLYNMLTEQSIDNINNLESFKSIIKLKLSEKFVEKKIILNNINNLLPDSSQHIITLKQQKQICKEIQINCKNKISMIFKIFLNRFYFNNFQFNKNHLYDNKTYFDNQLALFKDKEEYAKDKKDKMNVILKEIQEIQERIVYLKENQHMYINFKESNATLEKDKVYKQEKLKETELSLLNNIKEFIKIFIVDADKKSEKMKNNVNKIESILKQIVKINEFEQEMVKEEFFNGKMDLESEMIKFEKEKEYITNNDVFRQNSLINGQGQTLIAKSLYQKEQLDSLLISEREITKQIQELQNLTDQFSETEQHELDMLEKDLVDKQLSLVKYYLTVENDNTKKNLTRDMMQSLYKTKYNVEHKENVGNYDNFEESKSYDKTRNAIVYVYKSSIGQLREFNKLIYRMKIINAILELEYITQLSKQIESSTNKKHIANLKKELQSSMTKDMQNKILELEKISNISKENIAFAKYLKESIENTKNKQRKAKEKIYKEQKANLERKLQLLNEKIIMLDDFLKNDDLDVSVDIKKIKAEIKNIKKEKKVLVANSKKIDDKILLIRKESNLQNDISSVIQSADLIVANVNMDDNTKSKNKEKLAMKDESSVNNKTTLRKTDVNRILSSYSNSEQVHIKKTDVEEQVKNDW
ncbi:MAG: tetratricopeptide repeat protein [Endomicrobiaceae bacterium]|nr:tetratricopeptide repeat protein [Endomicrobiaceae bacterium]